MVRFAFAASSFLIAGAAGAIAPALPQATIDTVEQHGGEIVARVIWRDVDRGLVPPGLPATLRLGGRAWPLVLKRVEPTGDAAQGWAIANYAVMLPPGPGGVAVLSRGTEPGGFSFTVAAVAARPGEESGSADTASPARLAGAIAPAPLPSPAVSRDNPLLANLAAYRPIYGAFGVSHTTAGRIQVSFQYQLFGDARVPTGNWKEGFRFGYTQRMLWDVGRYSSPFHDVSYRPELFYAVRGATTASGVRFSGQAGIVHESNGKGDDDSRGYQTVYVQPTISVPLGRYTLDASPRIDHYVFGRDRNADLPRYWGHQSLELAIGTPDGLKLDATGRINFGTGRGAVEAELSYPLARIAGVPVYALVQGFSGYGEDLLDYDRRQSRLRLGLGLVR